jgi:cyclophilin family peptidyl-prolyl cis-trans isomerase
MALQHSPLEFRFLGEQLMKSKEPVIKSSAASALVAMNQHRKFDPSLSADFARIYKEGIAHGDMAVVGILCSALADSTLNYKEVIKDFSFLKTARNKLSLPRDYESVVPLEMAIGYFEGTSEPPMVVNDYNHPIDWNLVKQIPAGQQAIIKTSKGNITIRLFVHEAPGSVANFVSLASDKYYDGRRIHRVVPNFVVQDGCPRGDGWGSEAYSIRSEFIPAKYKTGAIGMASAGKDTEGTQWFITHSPTPHLEGRYTVFAEIEGGMDVVHRLEVGDTVVSIEIINFRPV